MTDSTAHVEGRVPSTDLSGVREALHHAHPPELAERDWLDYDARSGDVRYRGPEDPAHLVLELADVFAA